MNSVGVGLIGAGPWGLTLARAFDRVAGARLRWICDLDAERRVQAAAAHPRARCTADVDDVLDDNDVAAVAVAVDSPSHHTVGMRALAAGRHLYVEKPLALSGADAAALHEAATSRGRVMTVGHLLLHHPAIRRARQIVSEGLLGDPLYFKSTRESVGAPRTAGSAWWALAPHDVSLAIDLFDAVPSVVSATGGGLAGAAHDSIASATMRFAGGRTAHVHVARFASEATRRVSVAGSRRTLTFDELAADARLQLLESATGILTRVPVDDVDPLLAQCDHFLSLVRRRDAASGNAPDLGNGAHALAVVRVLEAAALSMRTGGTPVDVDIATASATER